MSKPGSWLLPVLAVVAFTAQPPLDAALSDAGLFYAYDLKHSHVPGRVVFVPRSELPH